MKKALVISPSFNITNSIPGAVSKGFDLIKQSKNAINILLSIGIETEFGPLYNNVRFQNSGTIKERIDEIHDAFGRKDIDFILCAQGGHNSNDLISSLDYAYISNHWKPLLGISDLSVLLNAIYKETGRTTYHGYDFIWQIGLNCKETSVRVLRGFFHEDDIEIKKSTDNPYGITLREGYGEGKIIGGCLSSYALLFGTPYDPGNLGDDFIFFMEDLGIHYERLEAYLRTLKMQKYFKKCQGFIVGSVYFSNYINTTGGSEKLQQAILEIFGDSDFPILLVPDIGHISENRIIPIGEKCCLTASEANNSIIFPIYSRVI